MPYNLLVVGLRLVGQQFDNKSKWAIVEFGFALETFWLALDQLFC